MTAALALSSRTCVLSLRVSGITWKTEPMVTSLTLIGVSSGSRMSRIGAPGEPSGFGSMFQIVCDELVGLGRVAERAGDLDDEGQGEQAERADEGVLDQGRRPSWAISPPPRMTPAASLALRVGGPQRGDAPRRPPRRASASWPSARRRSRCRAGETPMVTPRARWSRFALPMPGTKTSAVVVDGEVRDDEREGAEHRDAEEGRDLTLGPLAGGLVVVGEAVDVRGQAGVLEDRRQATGADVVPLVEPHQARGSGPPSSTMVPPPCGVSSLLIVGIDPVDSSWCRLEQICRPGAVPGVTRPSSRARRRCRP